VRLGSWRGGIRWYSFGVLSMGVVRSVKADMGAALSGVGKTLAGFVKAERAESLLSGL
jgi:hypothetical protein